MAVNPAGFQLVGDGGIPQTFVGVAEGAVSGGWVVYAGSKSNPLSSGANSFTSNDILIAGAGSAQNNPIGVAMFNVGSGTSNYATVLTKGYILGLADGAINANQFVESVDGNFKGVGSEANPILVMNRVCGRSVTSAGSNQYALIRVDL